MMKTFFDFCSGIGGGRIGLEQNGLKCVGHSDTSRLADITYNILNDNADKNYGNLKRLNAEKLPDFDLLIAGFPCQAFSVIGRKDGFSDSRGQIIFHLARIIREKQPKVFILENVRGLVTHDKGNTIKTILHELESSGYDVCYKVLSSINYGVPQMRQRVYFIGFRNDLNINAVDFEWPDEIEKPPLSDYLLDNNLASPERLEILQYYLNNPTNKGTYSVQDIKAMEGKLIDTRMNDLRIYTDKCPTLRAQRDGILYVKGGEIYQLTGFEALLLQGFPYKAALKAKNEVSDRHLLMQAGNAMTVNVIKELGTQILKTMEEHMNAGEKFEKECLEYLKKTYENENIKFESAGGMDSTLSDIEVKKNNTTDFFIEVKMANAQSGQFVVIPDDKTKQFVFSPRNRSKQNDMTDIIIDYMNSDYEKFRNAGTAGSDIDIDSSVFAKWIVQHYKEKNVKYCISGDSNYVILPFEKYGEYFDISATYRIKKSGSSRPSKSLIPAICNVIKKTYIAKFEDGEKGALYARIYEEVDEDKFPLGEYIYFLAPRAENYYEVRKLSKTRNMNVIFSVKLKKEQDPKDLLQFEKDISN